MTNVRPSTTAFYRLDASTGWRQSEKSEGIVQDPVSAQLRLGKPGDYAIPANEPAGSFGGMTLPRGVTVSGDGRVLLADPAHNRILYFDNLACEQQSHGSDLPYPFRLLWRPNAEQPATEQPATEQLIDKATGHVLFQADTRAGAYELKQPHDVLFSPEGEIVVADTGHGRVLIYSWPDLRLRQSIHIAGSAPVALAYDSRLRLYVADADNAKVWRISRLWQIDHTFDGANELLTSPSALAVDVDDNVLVLDQKTGRIVFIPQQGEASVLKPPAVEVFSFNYRIPPFQLTNSDLDNSGQNDSGQNDSGQNNSGQNNSSLEYPLLKSPRCEALHLYGVRLDKKGNVAGTDLPLLVQPRRIRLPRSGVFFSEQLDNQQFSSQWHRIVMEGEIPDTAAIVIQTHTGDRSIDDSEIDDLTWSEPILISSELTQDQLEMLIQSGKGRYLRIRIEFLGDGLSSPGIRNIQVFGPRSSSLSYLPRPYHQDPESAYFLDRFLSYFDTVQEEIRFVINDFSRYLDPQGVPEGPFLDWLGSWFDWRFLAQWPTDLRREMIINSVRFYKLRGTLDGLKQMLQWHTGLKGGQPEIIEHFRLRHYADILGHTPQNECDEQQLFIAEKPLTPPTDKLAHWFSVVLPISVVPDEAAYQMITELITSQKPAHTEFQLCVFSPGLRIGKQSSIGIDTWLGHYPREPVGSLTLGQSSELVAPASSGLSIGQELLN